MFDVVELTGTEKQIAWANKLREILCNEIRIAKKREYPAEDERTPEQKERFERERAVCLYIQHNIREAKWWIDMRDCSVSEIMQAAAKRKKEEEELEQLAEESSNLFIVKSEDASHDGVVTTKLLPDKAYFEYKYDKEFIDIMHKHGCEWDYNKWVKRQTVLTPSAIDLLAEICAHLLKKGFVVEFPNAETRDKSLNGDYRAESSMWVHKYNDTSLYFIWREKDDDLFRRCRRIKGATYQSPHIVVPVKNWKAILDIADECGFEITDAAQKLIDDEKAKASYAQTVVVNDISKEKLLKTETILEDLTDDD